jgi:hypothetical protein
MVKISVPTGHGGTTINTNNVWDRIVALENGVTVPTNTALSLKADKSVVDGLTSQMAERTTDLVNLKIRNLPIVYDDYARTALANMCNDYLSHYSDFVYGGYYDAFRYFAPVNGKYEISCSVFVMLILSGIPYKNSKYGGGNNTPNGEGYYNQDLIDFYSDVSGGSQTTFKYSQHLAEYLYDRGFCYYAEPDFSNVDTGDILFYSNNTNPLESGDSNRFLGIDHSCIYSHKQNDNTFGVYEVQNEGPVFGKYLISNYKPVLCARLPRKNGSIRTTNIVTNPKKSFSVTTSTVRTVTASNGFKANKQYTLVTKITYVNNTPNVYPGLKDQNGINLMSHYGATKLPDDNIYVLPFSPTSDMQSVTLDTRIATTGLDVTATCEWCTLYEGLLLNKKDSTNSINTVSIDQLAGFTVSSQIINQDGFTVISGTITGDISASMVNVATITTTKKVNVVVGSLINDSLVGGLVMGDFRGTTYYLRAKNTGTTNYFSIVIPN